MCIKLSEVNVRILARVVVSERSVFELSTNQQLNVSASDALISRRWLMNDNLNNRTFKRMFECSEIKRNQAERTLIHLSIQSERWSSYSIE
jgi:hypothetical protein